MFGNLRLSCMTYSYYKKYKVIYSDNFEIELRQNDKKKTLEIKVLRY